MVETVVRPIGFGEYYCDRCQTAVWALFYEVEDGDTFGRNWICETCARAKELIW